MVWWWITPIISTIHLNCTTFRFLSSWMAIRARQYPLACVLHRRIMRSTSNLRGLDRASTWLIIARLRKICSVFIPAGFLMFQMRIITTLLFSNSHKLISTTSPRFLTRWTRNLCETSSSYHRVVMPLKPQRWPRKSTVIYYHWCSLQQSSVETCKSCPYQLAAQVLISPTTWVVSQKTPP